MEAPTRKTLVSLAKWCITLGLLVVVLRRIPLGDLGARLARLGVGDVAVLVGIATLQVALNAMRWWRLLRGAGERVSYAKTFGDLNVGLLYNFLLPGGIGGDVVRALRMRKRVTATHLAWSTSIMERIMGLFTMAVLASAAAVFGIDETLSLPGWLRWLALGLVAVFALVLAFAAHPFRLVLRVLGQRVPEAARGDLEGIGADLSGRLAGLPVRAEAFGWSVAYQIASIGFVIASASALGAPGHARAIMIGVPLVFVLSIAPITVGGHGLREGLYVGVLGVLGVPSDVALGLSAMYVASSLLFSGVGALFQAFDRG